MRRFAFYVLVTVLTFGISSFIAFKKFVAEQKPQVVEKTLSEIQNSDALISKDEDVFEDEIRKPLLEDNCKQFIDEFNFRPIIKRWMNGDKFKNELYCANTAKEMSSYNITNVKMFGLYDTLLPTLIDLNADGRNELALQSGCSPTGNCEMKIFQKTKKSYREIFTAFDSVQTFELKTTQNKGYYDIWAKSHGSIDSGGIVSYRYDGEKYKVLSCFDYYYEQNYGEPVETRAKPKLKLESVKCS